MVKLKNQRYEYIDLLEVCAILFVIVYHTRDYNYNFVGETGGFVIYIPYFLRAVLSTCVPLFFFANGFLLLNRDFNLKKHIIKSCRLGVLTFVWGAIDIFFLVFIENTPLTFREFLKALWSWKYGWINHLWYMGALICVYVFFPLIKEVYDNHRKIFYYFVIITAVFTFGNTMLNLFGSILAYALRGREGLLSENWFNIFNPYRGIYGYAFVYFCIGGCINNFLKVTAQNRRKSNLIAGVLLIISTIFLGVTGIILSKISGEMWDVVWNGYDTIFTFINVIAIFVLVTNYKGTCKTVKQIITLISCNTLGIYFVHVVYIHWLRPYFDSVFYMSNITINMIGNVLFTCIVLLLSLLTAFFVKKIPLLKCLL